MKIEINTEMFRRIFDFLNDYVEKASCVISEEGINILELEEGRCCYIDIKIHKNDIETFEIESDNRLTFSVSDMVKVLKRIKTENITLTLKDVYLSIGVKDNKKSKHYSVQLQEKYAPDLSIERLMGIEFDNTVVVSSSMLSEIISDLELYNEEMRMITKQNIFSVTAYCQGGDYDLELEDDGEHIRYQYGAPSDVTIATRYIKPLKKLALDEYTIHITDYMPVRIYGMLYPDTILNMFIAPRIKDEDMDAKDNEEEATENNEEVTEVPVEEEPKVVEVPKKSKKSTKKNQ